MLVDDTIEQHEQQVMLTPSVLDPLPPQGIHPLTRRRGLIEMSQTGQGFLESTHNVKCILSYMN